jgi:hypothetical protein
LVLQEDVVSYFKVILSSSSRSFDKFTSILEFNSGSCTQQEPIRFEMANLTRVRSAFFRSVPFDLCVSHREIISAFISETNLHSASGGSIGNRDSVNHRAPSNLHSAGMHSVLNFPPMSVVEISDFRKICCRSKSFY